MEPSPPGMLRTEPVFYVIGFLPGIIPYRIPVFRQNPFLILFVQQIRPGFYFVRKILFVLISEHIPKNFRPGAGNHPGMLVKLHAPKPGAHRRMDIFHGRLFPLNLRIRGADTVCVRLFLFQKKACVFLRLVNNRQKYQKHPQNGNHNLNNTAPKHPRAN